MTDMDRGKDFEPDIYATHEEDYDDFDVEEEEEGGSRAAIILIVVIGVVLLLGVAFVSYRVGYDNGQREASVPRLQAANQGGKVQPDDPGGLQPPQESALDESITGGSEEDYDKLLPRQEEVVAPEGAGDGESTPVIDIPTIGVDPDTESLEPNDAPDSVPVQAPSKPKAQETQQAAESQSPSSSNPGKIMVPKPGVAVPSPSGSPTIPAPAAESAPAPAADSAPAPSGPAPSASTSGDYVVQLASLPSQEAADAAWRSTSAKFPDLLDGAFRDVQEADLGERGIFYRLRVGYFESKSEADRLCGTLKSRGQDCLVVTR